jgi:hypothetical protein
VGSRRLWWLCEFFSVKISGLGNFLEQPKLCTLRALGPLKCCLGRIHGSEAYTLKNTGRTIIWGHTGHSMGGGRANCKTLVTNDETYLNTYLFHGAASFLRN